MLNRILYRIASRLPARMISDNGRPYLERYFVASGLGVTVYLHRFVDSDPARGLHDHPWPWAFSVLLLGHYWELTRQGGRRVRWFNWLAGDSFHMVVIDRPVWSLFVHRSKRTKGWGFLRDFASTAGESPTMKLWTEHVSAEGPDWWLKAPKGHAVTGRMPEQL